MTRRCAAWGVLLCLGLPGCLGGIGVQEMPEPEIALYWYDVETERKRAEAVDATEQRKSRGGIAHVDDMSGYLSSLLGGGDGRGSEASLAARYPGRFAFLDPRSEDVRPLERTLTGAIPRAWSPDRTRLMYSQTVGNFRQLFEYIPDTGEVRQLTRGPGVHSDGCYLPDGRRVYARAEVRGERPVARIVVTEAGAAPRPISEGPADYAPDCAPDGHAVAWVMAQPRGRDVLVTQMPPLDGKVRKLGPGRSPSFSPDGQWIVFSAPVERSRWRLYRIRPDGSGRKAIGSSSFDELQPTFSPDGKLVVYVADDGFHKRIYVRRFDGSGDRVLLRAGGGEHPV